MKKSHSFQQKSLLKTPFCNTAVAFALFTFQVPSALAVTETVDRVDEIQLQSTIVEDWYDKEFSVAFTSSPIVITGSLGPTDDAAVVRLKDVSATGFKISHNEWPNTDGLVNPYSISTLAFEPGPQSIGGLAAVADSITVGAAAQTFTFSTAFSTAPAIFANMVTDNDVTAAAIRMENITTTGFDAWLQSTDSATANNARSISETVHFVAMEPGTGVLNGRTLTIGITGKIVEEDWETASTEGGGTSSLFSFLNTNNGSDTGIAQAQTNGTEVQVRTRETTYDDAEQNHAAEIASWATYENNTAPVIAVGQSDQNINEKTAFSYTVPTATFTDANANDNLTLSITSTLPSWLSFDTSTNTLSGTPSNNDLGTVSISIKATDESGAFVEDLFDVTIVDINDAPTVNQGIIDQDTLEDAAFLLAVPSDAFADQDAGDTLSYSIVSGPNWLTISGSSLSGTPAEADVGISTVTLRATDSGNLSSDTNFSITVVAVNKITNLINSLPVTAAELTAEGIISAEPTREDYYNSAIAAANPQPSTLAELQAVIDAANVVAEVVENAGNGTTSETIATELATAGVDRIIEQNSDAYETAIANTKPSPTTVTELQAIVDEVNDVANTVAAAGASDGTLIDKLNAAGLVNVDSNNSSVYETVITNTDPAPVTVAELQTIIDEVNAVSNAVSAAELADGTLIAKLNLAGLIDVDSNNGSVYEAAITAATPVPNTAAELQAIIDDVNATATAVAAANTSSNTLDALVDAGVNDLVDSNTGAYEAAISNANPVPATAAELQAIVDQVNAIASIVEAASNRDGSLFAELTTAGVTRVIDGNLAAYETAIANAAPAPTNTAELQAIVDEVNALEAVLLAAESLNSSAGGDSTDFSTSLTELNGVPTISNDLLEEFAAMIARANPQPQTAADIVAIANALLERSTDHPVVYLTLMQEGVQVQQVRTDGGTVIVSAVIANPVAGLTASYDWSGSDEGLFTLSSVINPVTELFSFEPAVLAIGDTFTAQVSITRNGLRADSSIEISIAAKDIAAAELIDSDGDGVSDAFEGDLEASVDSTNANKLQTLKGEDTSFVMEGQTGVILRLGEVARAAESNQVGISLDDLVEQIPGATREQVIDELPTSASIADTEVFDFEVASLPHAGSSVFVVLPLQQEMGANANYVKFHPATGWAPFVQDGLNQLRSAPAIAGILGLCPPIGHSAYSEGLGEGHACIELKIEDGGSNDADRLNTDGTTAADLGINGNVEDPGAIVYAQVSALGSSTTSTTLKGGGSVAPWSLVIIGLLTAGRRRKRSQRL